MKTPEVFFEASTPVQEKSSPKGVVCRGFLGAIPVYHVVSPVERELAKLKLMTALGIRYISDAQIQASQTVALQAPVPQRQQRGQPHTPKPNGDGKPPGLPIAWNPDKGKEDGGCPPNPPNTPTKPNLFEIRKSQLGGFGAFAVKDITKGTHILVDKPLFRTTAMDLVKSLDALNPSERAKFFALHPYSPDPTASIVAKIWNANA